jgi:hypothetical protein
MKIFGTNTLGDENISGSLTVSGSILSTGNIIGNQLLFTNRQTGSYVLTIEDAGKLIEMESGSNIFLTIPSSSLINYTIGTQIMISQYGAGQLSITTGSSTVYLRSAGNRYNFTSQYSGATLIKSSTDEWYLFGDLS